jgi:hypothetical protein
MGVKIACRFLQSLVIFLIVIIIILARINGLLDCFGGWDGSNERFRLDYFNRANVVIIN